MKTKGVGTAGIWTCKDVLGEINSYLPKQDAVVACFINRTWYIAVIGCSIRTEAIEFIKDWLQNADEKLLCGILGLKKACLFFEGKLSVYSFCQSIEKALSNYRQRELNRRNIDIWDIEKTFGYKGKYLANSNLCSPVELKELIKKYKKYRGIDSSMQWFMDTFKTSKQLALTVQSVKNFFYIKEV